MPKIIGNPLSPEPITIILLFGDSASLIVASIPLSCNILSVNEALSILFDSALPSASIITFSASFLFVKSHGINLTLFINVFLRKYVPVTLKSFFFQKKIILH